MPNALESVDPTVLAVMARLEGARGTGLLPRVRICLSEALNNLVLHAETRDRSAPIDVVLTVEAAGAQVGLEIFDPAGAQPFDLRDHAADLSTVDVMAGQGRGLALILDCADSVAYGSSEGRNRLALGFVGRDETRNF